MGNFVENLDLGKCVLPPTPQLPFVRIVVNIIIL